MKAEARKYVKTGVSRSMLDGKGTSRTPKKRHGAVPTSVSLQANKIHAQNSFVEDAHYSRLLEGTLLAASVAPVLQLRPAADHALATAGDRLRTTEHPNSNPLELSPREDGQGQGDLRALRVNVNQEGNTRKTQERKLSKALGGICAQRRRERTDVKYTPTRRKRTKASRQADYQSTASAATR